MVNENHFQFDRKHFFNFWKMIYGFKNRKSFSELKPFILPYMFVGIRHCQALEFLTAQICKRRSPDFGIRLLEFGDTSWILALSPSSKSSNHRQIAMKLAICAEILQLYQIFGKIGQNLYSAVRF
jgi:hypothetical protein